MQILHFGAGQYIADAAKQIVEAAREHGAASGKFNDIEITADAETTVDQVLERWDQESAARAKAYANSPEGKAAERERNKRRGDLQRRHDELMQSLPALDMGNDVAVLDWLCAMQEPSDHMGVIVRRETVVSWFEKHGYVAGENCGADFRKGDRKNEFCYLVGQALDGLKRSPAIHGILHKFAAEWKAQFLPTTH